MYEKEQALLNEIELLLSDKGYIIENIIYSKSKKLNKRSNLKLVISNKNNNPINIEDCKIASKEVSLIIDVKNLISEPYNLEISSKGCEDSLFFVKDFISHVGKLIKVELFSTNQNKYNNIFYAVINKITGDKITLSIVTNTINEAYPKNYLITVPIKNIKSAVLVKDRSNRSFNERTI